MLNPAVLKEWKHMLVFFLVKAEERLQRAINFIFAQTQWLEKNAEVIIGLLIPHTMEPDKLGLKRKGLTQGMSMVKKNYCM